MKLQVINEEREPESVAPKIKVFDSEADLDAALPDLQNGAIVATKEVETVEYNRDRNYGIWNTERNVDYWLIADKPQGIVHVNFVSANQQIEVIWNVATAQTYHRGFTGGDACFRGMEDPVYGKPYLMVRTTENIGSYFIGTNDCILTIEQRPH